MIIYFSVQNFRSLRDKITLDFRATPNSELAEYYIQEFPDLKLKLLKLAMIFGKNASGKTNILRALDFLRNSILQQDTDKSKPTGTEPFALDKDKNSVFDLKFVHEDIVYQYQLTLNQTIIVKEHLHYWPKGTKTRVFTRDLQKLLKEAEYKYNWSGSKANKTLIENLELTVPNQSVLASLKKYNYSGPMQQVFSWFQDTLAPIVEPNTSLIPWNLHNFLNSTESCEYKDFYVQQLQIADFIISNITVKKEEVALTDIPLNSALKYLINAIEKDNNKMPETVERIDILLSHKVADGEFILNLEEESAGTQRFFEFCGFLCWMQQTNKIIPIDEIERAMHEDLIEHFIASYLTYAKKSQLILTSHNSSILNMKDIIRRDTIWITDRLENGATELSRLTEYPIKKEHSIANLYRKGLIGGKPDIGSIGSDGSDES
ncbi:MAG: AAA family ATPase [Candidatus Cloacimonetes bacterium]|jgi:hypothetical protein|nr:AAA family ATPase [Candidatus Cloacimonadota bacterium]MCB5287300.1 AAA family ATPase [Candidatus Cloacimonadota bacterium]MCK9185311.1 AAA family ATPase [Candidatus Cloacimonadota bacterium]MCK9583402.1 AAA family ATPase [Candidatus Cloacimonadota bacterium]MDY0229622.1 AAA family ATPase [Candidatus Cloacimonadaceae bacterium]